MKTKLTALALAFSSIVQALPAQLSIPNADGSDGALIIGTNTVIDLSKAVTGSWTNTSASPGNPGNGTYDPNQWAVVFKYSSVFISNNATLSFLNNATHAPVVWLVSGNVTINGTLNLDGQPGNNYDAQNLAEPGPGGFRGGGEVGGAAGPGFGPGGALSEGYYYGSYGNPQIIPLIGGSGGCGNNQFGYNGNGGGGAMLIAATGAMNLTNGSLHANGGYSGYSPSGSGGAIRLVADQIAGNGSTHITAVGGGGTFNNSAGGVGRIRLEGNSVSSGMNTSPTTSGVTPDSPPIIFPTNAATVSIYSVAGITNGLADPKAMMSSGLNADDVTLVTTNKVTIQLLTRNFPTNGTVTVLIKPRNAAPGSATAVYVTGDTNAALWQATNISLLYPAHTVIQAHATF